MSKIRAKELRESIKKLSKWESSGKAFGFIDNKKIENPDYIYEFFCAMKILNDLKSNHKIELKPGANGYKFPQKPGNKNKWARFHINDRTGKNVLLQCCLGVKIELRESPTTTFSADISFQKCDAPDDNPDDSHVVLIMDAKYKKSIQTKLDIGTIKEFAMNVADMAVPKATCNRLAFNNLTALNANCLFTNGEAMDDHRQYCINHNLKQVGKFDCDGRRMEVIG